jgi:hypothetical protein
MLLQMLIFFVTRMCTNSRSTSKVNLASFNVCT